MNQKPISDLHCRMLEDMSVGKFGKKTQSEPIWRQSCEPTGNRHLRTCL